MKVIFILPDMRLAGIAALREAIHLDMREEDIVKEVYIAMRAVEVGEEMQQVPQ